MLKINIKFHRKCITSLLSISIVLFSSNIFASLLTLGDLSRDDNSNVVYDSSTNLEWLMWNYEETYTYQTLHDLVAPGGAYEGWSVANANTFYQMLGSGGFDTGFMNDSNCTDNNTSTHCNGWLTWESISNSNAWHLMFLGTEQPYSIGVNYVMYEQGLNVNPWKEDAVAGLFGLDIINNSAYLYSGWIHQHEDVTRFTQQDSQLANYAIRHALYREHVVPIEPSSSLVTSVNDPLHLAIFSLGFIFLISYFRNNRAPLSVK
jgi:hypothetical protein